MASKIVVCCVAAVLSAVISGCNTSKQKVSLQEVWALNSLTVINGHAAEHMGKPTLINTPYGAATNFDGDGDRLLVDANPLDVAQEFTIEIIFNAHDVYPSNSEPRIFHIESPANPNRRITIELRLNERKQWYFDGFIKSEKSQLTLIDPARVHPVGEWAHAAITFKGREFTSYVNGAKELSGEVDYLDIPANAKTSIGARMNKIHWFNGDVLQVLITKKQLQPKEFVLLDKLHKVKNL